MPFEVQAEAFYIYSGRRRMTVDELFRLQGFMPLPTQAVRRCAMLGMSGNAMSLNVVVRVFSLALPSVGFVLHGDLIDPREHATARAQLDPSVDTRLQEPGSISSFKVWHSTVLSGAGGFSVFFP